MSLRKSLLAAISLATAVGYCSEEIQYSNIQALAKSIGQPGSLILKSGNSDPPYIVSNYASGDFNNDSLLDEAGTVTINKGIEIDGKFFSSYAIDLILKRNTTGNFTIDSQSKKRGLPDESNAWAGAHAIKRGSVFMRVVDDKPPCKSNIWIYQYSKKYDWQLIGVNYENRDSCKNTTLGKLSANLLTHNVITSGCAKASGKRGTFHQNFHKYYFRDFDLSIGDSIGLSKSWCSST